MQFSIAVPPGNLRGPEYTEQLLAALHSACPRKWGFELHLRPLGATVGQACRLPSEVVPVFTERVADAYPDATIAPIPAAEEPSGTERRVWRQELWLSPDLGMVKTFRHFADPLRRTVADPIAGVLSALRRRDDGVEASVVIHLRPGAAWRIYIAQFQWRILSIVLQTSWPAPAWFAASLCRHYRYVVRFIGNALLAGAYASARAATVAPSPKLTGPLFEARVVLKASAPRELRPKAVERLRELRSAFSPFRGEAAFQALRVRGRRRLFRTRFLLSAEEAATLWHPPTETVRVAEMARADYRQLEPPADLPTPESHEELAVLGTVDFRRHQNQCGLLPDDRRRHLAVVGKTGMGKTTLLQSLLENDITAGRGAGLIDPHGDLAESLLARIPRHRTNDVVYFDAGDRDRPVAYNPLTARDRLERPLVASGVVSAFKKLYGDSWGPRLEYIFRNALLTLLDMPQASLAALPRLLTDKSWRTQALTHVEDDVIRSFWLHEFQAWKPQFQAEACAPILNKVGQFLAHPILRAILTPERSALDLSRVLDRSGILVANLSKGRIGEDGATPRGSIRPLGVAPHHGPADRRDAQGGSARGGAPRLLPVRRRVPELRHRFLRNDPFRGAKVPAEPDDCEPVSGAGSGADARRGVRQRRVAPLLSGRGAGC